MSGGWVLVPLGVEEEAFYVPNGYKVLDPETLLLEAELAVRDRCDGWAIDYTEPISGDLVTLTYTDLENQA